jgi:metal-dependent amidase/aminoacylase/carboxypeptidase family protein
MLCKIERQRDREDVLQSHSTDEGYAIVPNGFTAEIDDVVESLRDSLWPLNIFIHTNPELAFEEHKAHDASTKHMQLHENWHVTRSAYGLATAWVAVYDSGKPGPVVSFNAEMGASSPLLEQNRNPR